MYACVCVCFDFIVGFKWAEIQNRLAPTRDRRGKYTKEKVEKESRMSKTQTKARKEGESNSQSECYRVCYRNPKLPDDKYSLFLIEIGAILSLL